ncbi:hypothetical protein IWX90DRAFT_316534 [Phyllosticta citrichinensis]|uniref:Uncharacterized protein n=1 Tax=Phyllosticta citrichinensis TaxID=1130410 RepID=A0ABR1XJ74_9PEZI
MADTGHFSGSLDDQWEDVQDGESIFSIGLNPTGDAGSSFRTRNDPAAPYQRRNLIERKGAIDIRCNCLDVVHGLFTPNNFEELATLIILQFNFDSRKRARRIASANIVLEFSSSEPNKSGPEVLKISPFGSMAMVQTVAQEEKTRNAGFKLGAPPFAGAEAAVELCWGNSVTSETTDQTRIVGSIDLKGRNYGPPNSVSWTLLENETKETGIPNAMRTAILLKRQNEAKFQCTLKIDAKVDLRSSLERMFGGRPKDDPILFDPDMEPTDRLRTYDVQNVAAVDLEEISGVSFMKIYDGAIQHV